MDVVSTTHFPLEVYSDCERVGLPCQQRAKLGGERSEAAHIEAHSTHSMARSDVNCSNEFVKHVDEHGVDGVKPGWTLIW